MAKRKTRSSSHSRQGDVASLYRSKLEARQAAIRAREASRWAPSPRDRLDLLFATLLHTATKPSTKFGSVRKSFLERYVFPAATRRTTDRKALFRSSRMVVQAAQAKNAVSFREARSEMRDLWQEVKSKK